MKITELEGLWTAHNKAENFTVLIAALDKTEAHEIAASYFLDSHMSTESITVEKFKDANTKFDCDYILR